MEKLFPKSLYDDDEHDIFWVAYEQTLSIIQLHFSFDFF